MCLFVTIIFTTVKSHMKSYNECTPLYKLAMICSLSFFILSLCDQHFSFCSVIIIMELVVLWLGSKGELGLHVQPVASTVQRTQEDLRQSWYNNRALDFIPPSLCVRF